MTDAQLSLLLYQYAQRLHGLINDAEDQLPDDVMVERTFNSLWPPTKRTTTSCPQLDRLRMLASELIKDSELLEVASRSEKKTA